MNFTLSPDHLALQESARVFLSKTVDHAKLLIPGAGVEQAGYLTLWPKILDLGWQAMVIPECYGGLAMSCIDLVMIVGEMGRALAGAPLFGVLAGSWAVERCGTEAQKAEILGAVATGELRLALAIADANGAIGPKARGVRAEREGEAWRLTGTMSFVVDGSSADRLVVLGDAPAGPRFFIVDRAVAGVDVKVLDWRDVTREICSITFDVAAAEMLPGDALQAWPWILDRLHLVLAAESAAGTEKSLADAVDYAKQRVAFGRPIGGFQAIKHQLADAYALSECATAAVQYAAWALSEDDPRASLAASMAQSYASEAYRDVTYRNIQIFGAIGFTWQMPNHLYYKRARGNAEILGAPHVQREQVVYFLEQERAISTGAVEVHGANTAEGVQKSAVNSAMVV